MRQACGFSSGLRSGGQYNVEFGGLACLNPDLHFGALETGTRNDEFVGRRPEVPQEKNTIASGRRLYRGPVRRPQGNSGISQAQAVFHPHEHVESAGRGLSLPWNTGRRKLARRIDGEQ